MCDLSFFFKQKTAYEMRISDWSSDVCSSDLPALLLIAVLSLNSWMLAGLLVSVVIYDFLSHEESRRLLYNGELIVWARFLMWRNVAMPLIWLSIIMAHRYLKIELSGMNEALAISSMAVMWVWCVNFYRTMFIPLEDPGKYYK